MTAEPEDLPAPDLDMFDLIRLAAFVYDGRTES